jgi:hypothetical protein
MRKMKMKTFCAAKRWSAVGPASPSREEADCSPSGSAGGAAIAGSPPRSVAPNERIVVRKRQHVPALGMHS